MDDRFSFETGDWMGPGGKAEGCSSFGVGIWGGIDADPPRVSAELATIESAVASPVWTGESSGFAIRSPPRDWDRLRSPFMAGTRVDDRERMERPCVTRGRVEMNRESTQSGRNRNERQPTGYGGECDDPGDIVQRETR